MTSMEKNANALMIAKMAVNIFPCGVLTLLTNPSPVIISVEFKNASIQERCSMECNVTVPIKRVKLSNPKERAAQFNILFENAERDNKGCR